MLQLKSLSILNFKNHLEANFTFDLPLVCFVGNNGIGKTNILDAIHYLSFCKSYFNSIDSQNINDTQDFFVIQGNFTSDEKDLEVYCGVKRGDKKRFKLNKKDYQKLSDHIGKFPAVMVSPYDRDLIGEGSEVRRKFIDSIISQLDKGYLQNLISYNKILQQRNALIKRMAESNQISKDNFEVWNIQLAEVGSAIKTKRVEFLEEFSKLFNEYYALISGMAEDVEVVYVDSLKGEDDFLKAIEDNFKRDIILQYTSIGIHKDDLDFLIKGKSIKKFGSQGQQKSYLVALKLAQYEFMKRHSNLKPMLLLDDVFDKLDQHRVANIMKLVHDEAFGQVFITDTDRQRMEQLFKVNDLKVQIFEIKGETIEQETIS